MSKYNTDSNLNLNPKVTTIMLWLVSLLISVGLTYTGGMSPILIIIAALLVLFFEKKHTFIRNHAAQVLVLNLVALATSIILNSLFRIIFLLVGYIPLINSIFALTTYIVFIAISVVFALFNFYGLLKALQNDPVSLPIIGKYGTMFEDNIK